MLSEPEATVVEDIDSLSQSTHRRSRPRTVPDAPDDLKGWMGTYFKGGNSVIVPPTPSIYTGTPLKTNRLWVVTTQFNPAGYKSLSNNYIRFARHMRDSGVNLLTAELTYPGQEPTIENSLRFQAHSVMWHKERLLNLAIKQLPPECDMVAWIDADVIFTNPTWVENTVQQLTKYPVVQLFEQCIMLDAVGDYYKDAFGFAFSLTSGFLDNPGDRYTYFNGNYKHPGFAWAARRETIEAWGGLYDRHILGGGDFQMGLALVGDQDSNWYTRFGTTFQNDMLDWSHRAIKVTGGKLSYVPGMIMHMWHGHSEDRQYVERSKCLVDYEFDPQHDICEDDSGLWKWCSDKPFMHEKVAEYFVTRKEDANLPVHPTRYQDKYPLIIDPDGGNDAILDIMHRLSEIGRTDFCVHIACYDWKQLGKLKPLIRAIDWPFQVRMKASYQYPQKEVPRRLQLAKSISPDIQAKRYLFVDKNTVLTKDFIHKITKDKDTRVVLDTNGKILMVHKNILLNSEIQKQSTTVGEDRVIKLAHKWNQKITTYEPVQNA